MPNYSASGEENLRADPSVMASPDLKDTPGRRGEEAGGAGTDAIVKSNPGKSTPGGKGSTPSGVQTFDDEV